MKTIPLLLSALLACSSAPSPGRSQVGCGPCEARADGFARVRVRVWVRDAAGRPVSGARVLIGDSGSAVSDGDGEAWTTFRSSKPGERLLDVRLPDGTPLGSVAVGFFAGSYPRVGFGLR